MQQLLSPTIHFVGRAAAEALDVHEGVHRVAWEISVGGPDYASPAVGQNGQIYTANGDNLVALEDLDDHARVVWRFPVKQLIEVSPAVGPDGTIVIGTNNDGEYGIHPDGTKAWVFDIGDYTYSSPVIRSSGRGAFADNSGLVRTFDAATGQVEQTFAPAAPQKQHAWTSVVIDAAGDTYWASTTGQLYGYDPHGAQLFTAPLDAAAWAYPALGADGTPYIGTTAGTCYAFTG